MTYTLITIGLFIVFSLAVILPIRIYAKRKGRNPNNYHVPEPRWDRHGRPEFYHNMKERMKEW